MHSVHALRRERDVVDMGGLELQATLKIAALQSPLRRLLSARGSKLKKPLRYASHSKAFTASQILSPSLSLSGVGDDQYRTLLLEQIRICNGLDRDKFSTALLKKRLFTAHAAAK